jgi:hypothetical protein
MPAEPTAPVDPNGRDPLAEIADAARGDRLPHASGSSGRWRGWRWVAVALLGFTVTGSLAWHFHDRPRYRDGIRYDPIEDDPDAQAALRAAEREADELLKDEPRRLGFSHCYWGTKKAILREKYGIDWRTPAELNPKIAFD